MTIDCRRGVLGAFALCWLAAANRAIAQQGNSPADRPVGFDSVVAACVDSAVGPLVAQARTSFPGFAQRVQAGLPSGYSPSVTVRLRDDTGRYEQVFVGVDSIERDSIYGRINSPIEVVHGYRRGQALHVPVSAILDWTISRPDGTEEGNLLGKYIDALVERLRRSPQRKPC